MTTQILTFSSLYPNASQPGLGLFVEARLQQLMRVASIAPRVVAPVPWFPLKAKIFGKYGQFARVPDFERRQGVDIWHPRYFHLPKVAMNSSPKRIAKSSLHLMNGWPASDFLPQMVDAHYFYPDGVAAASIAQALDVPLMITARGSDINLISQHPPALAAMRQAAQHSSAIIGVSAALADRMIELGFGESKVHVLRNGVDLEFFKPVATDELALQLQLDGQVLLSVGNLIELKGHHLVIDALARLPNTTLLIAGSGPMEDVLKQQCKDLDVSDRVRFLGQVNQAQLPQLYSIADALILASSREGLANVLLESIACGNPVIATNVGGNPEVVCDARAGVLLEERTADAIVDAVKNVQMSGDARKKTREFAQRFSWLDTCHKLDQLISSIL